MPIDVTVTLENDLTIFIVEGNSSFTEFMAEIKSFYDGRPTRNALWNLDRAFVWDITVNHIKMLAQYPPRIEKANPEKKTALVASDEITISLSKLFEYFGQSKGLKRKVEIFKTMGEALEWLKAD